MAWRTRSAVQHRFDEGATHQASAGFLTRPRRIWAGRRAAGVIAVAGCVGLVVLWWINSAEIAAVLERALA